MSESNMLTFLMWGFGICASGFLFLFGCFWWVARQLPAVKEIASSLAEIKDALLGTMSKPGFISKLQNVNEEVHDLKMKVNELLSRPS